MFSSAEAIRDFRLVQRVYLGPHQLEEWRFEFGFVIPGSTNAWQSTIEAAGEGQMLDPEEVSGHVTIETEFLDADTLIDKSHVRILYVAD